LGTIETRYDLDGQEKLDEIMDPQQIFLVLYIINELNSVCVLKSGENSLYCPLPPWILRDAAKTSNYHEL